MVNPPIQPMMNPGDWPLVNNYQNRCGVCNETFFGPKRATTCWNHTSETFQKMWFDTAK